MLPVDLYTYIGGSGWMDAALDGLLTVVSRISAHGQSIVISYVIFYCPGCLSSVLVRVGGVISLSQ